jgi:autotransporter-associated beta strand protein
MPPRLAWLALVLLATAPGLEANPFYWTGAGGDGNLLTATNWSPSGTPTNGNTVRWDGRQAGHLDLVLADGSFGGTAGVRYLFDATQTGNVSITAPDSTPRDLRTGTGSFSIAARAGAVLLDGHPDGLLHYVLGSSTNAAATFQIVNNSANPLTFGEATRIVRGNTSANHTVQFAGSGKHRILGTVASMGSGGTVAKQGTGTLELAGTMEHTGNIDITAGTVEFRTAAALGDTGNRIQIGQTTTASPVLRYTGAVDTAISRPVQVGNGAAATHTSGAVIENDGAGRLVFAAAGFNLPDATATAPRILTLGGTNATNNEIAGAITDNSALGGQLSLVKTGTGRWVLSATSTYTGDTTVQAGTLVLAARLTASRVIVQSGATLNLAGRGIIHDLAELQLASGASLQMDFTGTALVRRLSLDGGATWLPEGTYGAAALQALGTGSYSGTGSVKVQAVPDAGGPNVIVILVDDMGWSDSAPYGSTYYDTPNLTRLAAQGMRFTSGYVTPLCSPTRASILTGQHPARHRLTTAIGGGSVPEPQVLPPDPGRYCGDVQSRDRLPLGVTTLAEVLRFGGYRTAHIGKWHLAPRGDKEPAYLAGSRGFDFVIGGNAGSGPPSYYSPYTNGSNFIPNLSAGPAGEHLDARLANEAIGWMESVKATGQPFFLNFWPYAVHTPITARTDLLAKYQGRPDPRGLSCPEMGTMIESMDQSVGMLLDWLDRPENAAVKANTLIVLLSDNGGVIQTVAMENGTQKQPTSNRPLRGGKASTFEGGLRVPWIVSWPGHVAPGSLCHTPVSSEDIFPTVLEAAEVALPEGHVLDGQSFLPLLEGGTVAVRPVFAHFPHIFGILCAPSTSVRLGDYKLLRYYWAGPDAATHHHELYDLSRDPFEAVDIAAFFPAKVAELSALLDGFLAETGAQIPQRNPDFTGNPRTLRSSTPAVAPLRPLSIQLAQPVLAPATATGEQEIRLLDQNGKPVDTAGIVVGGGDWVSVTNDGKRIVLSWDASAAAGPATVALGWSGGLRVHELNDWTFEPVVLTVDPPTLSGFAGWLQQYGLSGEAAAPDAAPAGDGIANLFKYAFNLDPTRHEGTGRYPGEYRGLPFLETATSDFLEMIYYRDPAKTGVSLAPEWREELNGPADWSEVTDRVIIGTQNGIEQWRARIPMDRDKSFLRMRVEVE